MLSVSCGEDEDPIDTTPKNVTFTFSAVANGGPVDFSATRYLNSLNQEFTIDRIKIYISNVVLRSINGTDEFVEPDSYHLVSLNPDNQTFSFTISDLPAGFEFDQVSYQIGIDADKNLSTDNTGDLDPANDMAWNWNTGYKFFLMEGNFFPGEGGSAEGLVVHIGTNNNLQLNNVNITPTVQLTSDATIVLEIDALAPLDGPNDIDFDAGTTFKIGDASDLIAQNYSGSLINLVDINIQ